MLYTLAIVLFSLGMLMGFLLSIYIRAYCARQQSQWAPQYRELRDRLCKLRSLHLGKYSREEANIVLQMIALRKLMSKRDQVMLQKEGPDGMDFQASMYLSTFGLTEKGIEVPAESAI